MISGGSGELLTRLQAEKANPRGDVLVGPDIDVFDAAIDLFDGYKSNEDAAFPRTAVGPDNKYYGFSTNFQAFIVNTKMMPLDKAPQIVDGPREARVQGQDRDRESGAVGLGLFADDPDSAAVRLGRDGQDHRHRDVRDELAASPTRTSRRARFRSGSPASSTSSRARPRASRSSSSIRRTAPRSSTTRAASSRAARIRPTRRSSWTSSIRSRRTR